MICVSRISKASWIQRQHLATTKNNEQKKMCMYVVHIDEQMLPMVSTPTLPLEHAPHS